MTDLDPRNLHPLLPLRWEEVFDIWRHNEAGRPNWIAHVRDLGYPSWDEWRQEYVRALGMDRLEWRLYRVIDPAAAVPQFRGGPFTSWTENFYKGEPAPTFARIVRDPEIAGHPGIRAIMESFPKETAVLGLLTDGNVRIIEGMHRCCALTLAAHEGRTIGSDLLIALARHPGGPLPVVGSYTRR